MSLHSLKGEFPHIISTTGIMTDLSQFKFLDYRKNKSKCGKWNHNVGESSNRRSARKPYFYYRLAPETPLPALFDESSYDSLHNYETGNF